MAEKDPSRFDAETVAKVVAVSQQRRLELRFGGAGAQSLVVSLPFEEAVAVARLICDSYEQTPFLGRAGRRTRTQAK